MADDERGDSAPISSETASNIALAVQPTGPDAAPDTAKDSATAATAPAFKPACDISELDPSHKRAIIYCALCFFALFSSWSPTQSYISTIHPSFALWSIIIIYFCLGTFGVLAPSVIIRFGVRRSFVVSSVMYALFSFALSIESSAVPVGIASALVGSGGGVLWVCQGLFIKSVSVQAGGHAGYLTGLWFSTYSFAPLVGNAMAGGLISLGFTVPQLLYVCGSIAATACLMFFWVRDPPIDPATVAPLKEKVQQILTIWKDRGMQTLMLLMAAQGIAQSFQFAIFPSLVNALGRGSQHIGFILVAYGVLSIVVSYVAGRVLDARGWKWVTLPYMLALGGGYFLVAVGMGLASGGDTGSALTIFYICGVCFGMSDALISVLINATVVLWFETNSGPAFASYRVVGSSTWVVGVLIRLVSNATGALIATVVLSCLAIAQFVNYNTRTLPAKRALQELAAAEAAAAAADATTTAIAPLPPDSSDPAS